MQPRERVEVACARWGTKEVLRRAGEALRSAPDRPAEGATRELAVLLGQREHDPSWLEGRTSGHGYWARVWCCRALLYVWDDDLTLDVVHALGDDGWRVREMALRVVVLREIACADVLDALVVDDVPRGLVAAARAIGAVGDAEHVFELRRLLDDADPRVSATAERAFFRLASRVDLPPDEADPVGAVTARP